VDVELVLDARAELGEGPVWDAERERLLFVDILRGDIHEFDPLTGRDRTTHVGQPVGCVAPTAAGDWVVAARDGFYRVNPETGRVHLFAAVEAGLVDNRMNDGAVDSHGRFWAGSMSMAKKSRAGSLYRLDPDGTVTRHVTGVTTSNGLDWSADRTLMFYVDTGTNRVDVFDFDDARGEVSGRRPFVFVPALSGKPDGLVVDADGFIWLALWKGGALHRYSPDGRLDRVVKLPVSLVTKCAFGGPDLTDLYVTTAHVLLSDEERAKQPTAGA
jgi:sugar lactone lactonase YvrE